MTINIQRVLAETFIARAEHYASIGSTNDRAAECAKCDGEALPLLVVADQQTAGRGRGGNRWWTGEGALACSVLLQSESVGKAGARSQVAALATAIAVIDSVAPLVPNHRVGLHWPNDVFVAGRKLAGILIEVLQNGRQVIGIGLNSNNSLADAPAEVQRTAATLRDLHGRPCDQTALLIDLLRHLERALVRAAMEPDAIAARADAVCLQRGQELKVRWNTRTVDGRCLGIARDGAILLQTPAGTEAVYSGVVSGSDAP